MVWRVNEITGATYFCSGTDERLSQFYLGCIRMSEYDPNSKADRVRFVHDHPDVPLSCGGA
jgi:hypothetical protein